MDLESVITDFESHLRKLGLSENTGALLLQVNIEGKNYIKSYGNLNKLNAPAVVLANDARTNFIDYMGREVEVSVNAASTKKLHYDTINLLKEYTPDITIQEITGTYLRQLETYMRKSRGLAVNTIARHMKVIKRYINVAIKAELITKYPFLQYSIHSEETHREALTERELEILENYRDQLAERNEVLDAFLFSCYTGLRYSDICTFTKQNICSVNRKRWVIIRMIKTNHEIRIPISTIFEGKALALTRSIPRTRGVLFNLSNNQQTNRVLKRIARITGIKKDLTFHIARHTCATLLLYRGVSITTVQKILGHKSVKTTQIYSAVTDLTLERELKKCNKKKSKHHR